MKLLMKSLRPVRFVVPAIIVAALSSGCASHPSSQQIGTAGGAVIGGVLGSALTGGSTVGTVGGAAVGGVIGSDIGREQDRQRRRR